MAACSSIGELSCTGRGYGIDEPRHASDHPAAGEGGRLSMVRPAIQRVGCTHRLQWTTDRRGTSGCRASSGVHLTVLLARRSRLQRLNLDGEHGVRECLCCAIACPCASSCTAACVQCRPSWAARTLRCSGGQPECSPSCRQRVGWAADKQCRQWLLQHSTLLYPTPLLSMLSQRH